jgi:hypothetical protein
VWQYLILALADGDLKLPLPYLLSALTSFYLAPGLDQKYCCGKLTDQSNFDSILDITAMAAAQPTRISFDDASDVCWHCWLLNYEQIPVEGLEYRCDTLWLGTTTLV